MTGTSLVTPTGETRTNSWIMVYRGPETETRELAAHIVRLFESRDSLTQGFCATPRAFCILRHAATLPLFFELQTHTHAHTQLDFFTKTKRDASVRVVPRRLDVTDMQAPGKVCVAISLSLFFFLFSFGLIICCRNQTGTDPMHVT